MLIGLVKDSVLRCFCHTCSVNTAITGELHKPLAKLKKPRSNQPKKKRIYHAASEVRCEEKSRGGMCYEVILADPIADKPQQNETPTKTPKQVTADDINLKLQQAEERRKSFEASRLASIGERLAKLQEACRKRMKANEDFIAATNADLEEKLEVSSAKRDAHLKASKDRLQEHLSNVEAVRKQMDVQSKELREAIESKLKSAEETRGENLRKLMFKLKEHDEYVHKVRNGHEKAVATLREKIESKLVMAEANRMSEQLKKIEILREHDRRAEIVRANKQQLISPEKQDASSSG